MAHQYSFVGKIVNMEWGKNTYPVLPLPTEVGEQIVSAGIKHVTGTMNGYAFALPVTHAPAIDAVYLLTDLQLLAAANISTDADIAVKLHPTPIATA